jgi:hypothetical protein
MLHTLFSLSLNFLHLLTLQTSQMLFTLQNQMQISLLSMQSEMLFTKDYLQIAFAFSLLRT